LPCMIGPLLPFTSTSGCCGAARHCGHSCTAQHFVGSNVGVRTFCHSLQLR
jgi:hypothetical protein